MVAKTVYLFVGEDTFSKDTKLRHIKQEFLTKELEQFNLDVLYGRELNLKELQEKLLCIPVRTKHRIMVIKGAQRLREDPKRFILRYVRRPHPSIILILDIDSFDAKDEFLRNLRPWVRTFYFKEQPRLDTFSLARQIDLKKPDYALRLLNQLLKNGEKPERILGGLRYACEANITDPFKIRKRLKLLLNCDIDIKRGRLKSEIALERLVVSLSTGAENFFG